jgi:PAS domain-containing protein
MKVLPHQPKPERRLRQRCRVVTALWLFPMLGLPLCLWQSSLTYLNRKMDASSGETAQRAITQLFKSLNDQIRAVAIISRLYNSRDDQNEMTFRELAETQTTGVPSLTGIISANTKGHPRQVASLGGILLEHTYNTLASPQFKQALRNSLNDNHPVLSELIEIPPDNDQGVLVISPVKRGNLHTGYIIGIINYRLWMDTLVQGELYESFRLAILHGRDLVRNEGPFSISRPDAIKKGSTEELAGPAIYKRSFQAGRQDIAFFLEPIQPGRVDATDIISLIILFLGLCLSFLLTWLVYLWQWQTAVSQTEARDQRKRLERTGLSLLEIKSELDLILSSVREGIILYDMGREPVQANGAFLSMFHMTESGEAMNSGKEHHNRMKQILGNTELYWDIFNSLDEVPEKVCKDDMDVPDTGGGRGTERHYTRQASMVCNADGEKRGYVLIYKDLSNEKELDRVKNAFLSNITHELRSPLASIRGFAETLQRKPDMDPETRDEFVSIIYDEANRLQKLVEDVLDLRQMEMKGTEFKPQVFDLKVLVEDTLRGARSVLVSKSIRTQMDWS